MVEYVVSKNTIYTVLIIGLILGFAGGFLFARNKYKTQLVQTSIKLAQTESELKNLGEKISMQKKEGYKMQDGKIVVVKDGVEADMDKEVVLADGTKVGVDGVVVKKDGSVLNLQNGEIVWSDGSIAQYQAR